MNETPGKPYPVRLLQTGFHDCYYNMGLDEALLESAAQRGALPVLRFYGWAPQAVSVGYFQGLEEEVDTQACKDRGVDVIRRITGGGAVFHHAELTYSIILPSGHPLAGSSIHDSYRILCGGLIRGLALLGLRARFAPINDILCGDRKISGNAQTRRMNAVLQHGTVLLDLDVGLMFSLLKVPEEKMKGRLMRDVTARVTSLRAQGLSVGFGETEAAMIEGFRLALGLEFAVPLSAPAYPGGPAPAEDGRAWELAVTRFASPEWLYKR
ncbi:MAG: lipoate--protein ligase family protein [Treponema sp.]|jgi:lipoate-protein ligase A|nr:lipoate--protein ligase family protein [Treponema sp.]